MIIIESFWLLKQHYLHHTAPPKAQERLVLALGHLGCAHSGRALRDGNGRAQLRLYLSTKHAMLGEAGGGPWYAMILAGFLKTHWMAAVCPGIFVFLRIRRIRLASSAAKAWFLGYLRWAIVSGNGWRVVCGCCYIMACHVRSTDEHWALHFIHQESRMEKLDEGPAVAMTPVSVISDFWHILPLFFSFIHVFSFSPRAATFLSLDVVGKIPSGLQNLYIMKNPTWLVTACSHLPWFVLLGALLFKGFLALRSLVNSITIMDNYIRDIIYFCIFLLSPDCLLRNMPSVAGKTLFCCSNPRLCYLELEGSRCQINSNFPFVFSRLHSEVTGLV